MDKQQASKEIAVLLNQAEALIREAEGIADKSGVGFSWDLAYGMRGYSPKVEWDASDDWAASDEEYGWQSSSYNC